MLRGLLPALLHVAAEHECNLHIDGFEAVDPDGLCKMDSNGWASYDADSSDVMRLRIIKKREEKKIDWWKWDCEKMCERFAKVCNGFAQCIGVILSAADYLMNTRPLATKLPMMLAFDPDFETGAPCFTLRKELWSIVETKLSGTQVLQDVI
jgi:hypothetical protein